MSQVELVDQPNIVTVTESLVTVQVAPQGLRGPQGVQGIPGNAATVNVGTTSTLAPGSSATVVNSGTTSAAVFDFGIPEGQQGIPGVVAATAPITYDAPTQTVAIDPTGYVASVNTQTGAVVLGAADVGAYPDTNPSSFVDAAGAAAAAPVQSVNTQTGAVTLGASDVGAVPTSRQVLTSGTGLSGGGDLTADRTITLDPSALAGDVAFAALGAIPTGGATGQVLAKTSGTNYDTAWGAPQLAGGAARSLNVYEPFLDGFTGLVMTGNNAGLGGNGFASTPDSVALSITGDMEIVVKFTTANAQGTRFQPILNKGGTAVDYSFYPVSGSNNGMFFSRITSAGTSVDYSTSAATGFVAGGTYWAKVEFDLDNGSSQSEVKYYTSTDGVTFTLLATVTNANTTATRDTANELRIGFAPSANFFNGTIHSLTIRDGIGGTVVFDADFATQTADALAFTESSTNAATVAINTTRYSYGIPNSGFVSTSTQSISANMDYFEPFIVSEPSLVDMFGFAVSTAPASTATVHAAVYAATSNQQPTGAPLASWGPISVATSVTGQYLSQISPVTLPPGRYVLAMNSSVAFTARSYRRADQMTDLMGAGAIIVFLTRRSRTNAAFPNPSNGWSISEASTVGRNTFTALRWRAA
jgi:hypothetical protein